MCVIDENLKILIKNIGKIIPKIKIIWNVVVANLKTKFNKNYNVKLCFQKIVVVNINKTKST